MLPSSSFQLCLLLTSLALAKTVRLHNTDDLICPTPDDCYPKLFEATNEFKVRRQGQEFPRGIHVQMDVTTGEVRGKLMTPTNEEEEKQVSVVLDSESGSMKEVVSVGTETSDPEVHHEPKTEPIDKVEENKEPDFSGFTTRQRFTQSDEERYVENLAVVLAASKVSELNEAETKGMLAALEEVEYLVHAIAFGIKFSNGEGMVTVIDLLSHKDQRVRKAAALVLGSAMQNNPPVQHAAQKLDVVQILLQRLPGEEIPSVLSRLMYALSAAVRGNHIATRMVLDSVHGLTHLTELWERFDNETVRKKLALFVTDLLDVKMDSAKKSDVESSDESFAGNVNFGREATLNIQRDQAQADPFFQEVPHVDEPTDVSRRLKEVNKWCSLFTQSLTSVNASKESNLSLDSRDKMLRGLAIIHTNYPSACKPFDPTLTIWLKEERSRSVGDVDLKDYVSLLDEVAAR